MKSSAKFYHAGCPVCIEAQTVVESYLDTTKTDLEIVHLGEAAERLPEAEAAGVVSVPALFVDGRVLHLNHGADLTALK
ncbi:thioredoxin family protein [Actomonas aquatica]|uniref:Thioredoxin family protein n=1 Tax=Actomonas aquatica TaxID=2866162 RepID=A0ABZ1C1T5_9BACT|nr:thioredoxin family protein [Opitutus sp. WL0086]WRQ85574.1 thioredoxin family protein [Opitutus sp. WL0086]